MKLLKAIAITAFSVFALNAQAALLEIDGGYFDSVSPDNYFFGDGSVFPQYNFEGNLKALEDINITYTYIGSEAGWRNELWVDGALGLSNKGPYGTVTSSASAGDFLDFFFKATSYVGDTFYAYNGANPNPANPSFVTVLNVTYNGVFYDALIMFDDTGNWNDDNHDDLVIGINVSRVPEPTTAALLALGLLGLYGSRRLKK